MGHEASKVALAGRVWMGAVLELAGGLSQWRQASFSGITRSPVLVQPRPTRRVDGHRIKNAELVSFTTLSRRRPVLRLYAQRCV